MATQIKVQDVKKTLDEAFDEADILDDIIIQDTKKIFSDTAEKANKLIKESQQDSTKAFICKLFERKLNTFIADLKGDSISPQDLSSSAKAATDKLFTIKPIDTAKLQEEINKLVSATRDRTHVHKAGSHALKAAGVKIEKDIVQTAEEVNQCIKQCTTFEGKRDIRKLFIQEIGKRKLEISVGWKNGDTIGNFLANPSATKDLIAAENRKLASRSMNIVTSELARKLETGRNTQTPVPVPQTNIQQLPVEKGALQKGFEGSLGFIKKHPKASSITAGALGLGLWLSGIFSGATKPETTVDPANGEPVAATAAENAEQEKNVVPPPREKFKPAGEKSGAGGKGGLTEEQKAKAQAEMLKDLGIPPAPGM